MLLPSRATADNVTVTTSSHRLGLDPPPREALRRDEPRANPGTVSRRGGALSTVVELSVVDCQTHSAHTWLTADIQLIRDE